LKICFLVSAANIVISNSLNERQMYTYFGYCQQIG
jgi:hypothetical protein